MILALSGVNPVWTSPAGFFFLFPLLSIPLFFLVVFATHFVHGAAFSARSSMIAFFLFIAQIPIDLSVPPHLGFLPPGQGRNISPQGVFFFLAGWFVPSWLLLTCDCGGGDVFSNGFCGPAF